MTAQTLIISCYHLISSCDPLPSAGPGILSEHQRAQIFLRVVTEAFSDGGEKKDLLACEQVFAFSIMSDMENGSEFSISYQFLSCLSPMSADLFSSLQCGGMGKQVGGSKYGIDAIFHPNREQSLLQLRGTMFVICMIK